MGRLDNDFCIWLVSTKCGKVRKLRVCFLKVLGLALLVVVVALAGLYVVSDYARLRFRQGGNYFSMLKLKSERDTLHRTNKNLQQKVRGLKNKNVQAEEYKKEVEQRLKKLNEVLYSAKNLGVIQDKDLNALGLSDKVTKGGVGGLEIDCVSASKKSGKKSCVKIVASENWDADSKDALLKLPVTSKSVKTAEFLDQYIAAIRAIPFNYPSNGKVTSLFGARFSPFSKRWRVHQGVDFSLKVGSAVYATADGVVSNVKYSNTYGYYIDIKHTDRVMTRYAHLSKMLVKRGDKVTARDIIALSGSSGRSTGPHLHYEVRVDGKPKNPSQLFSLGQTLRKALSENAAA